MAGFINSIIKTSLRLRLLTPIRQFHITPVNHLYSSEALGIHNYVNARKKIKEQFSNHTDKFRNKMSEFVEDPRNMIFTEDLKNMVHIAERDDVHLVTKMIKKFNSQRTEFRFSSFIFGPVVMRMFYYLDAPQEALSTFLHPDISSFFDQHVSFQILLDLLYNHQMYDDMYNVFDIIKEKQVNMTKYPKYPVLLIFAACYKQNTPGSYKVASQLWNDMMAVGAKPLRRTATLMAGLALNQNQPEMALRALSTQRQHYVTIRNMKAMALADLNRPHDAITLLTSVLNIDDPDQKDKHTFFNETLEKIKECVNRSTDKSLGELYIKVVSALMDRKLIDHQTLDMLLTTEITLSPVLLRSDRRRRVFNTKKEEITL